MLNQLIVTSVAAGARRPKSARQIALAKPPQFHIINRATLIGYLGNDAEVRNGKNNQNFTTFSVATKTSYKDKESGEYISHTEWHRCIVFGKFGEFAATLKKGAHVQVEGEIRHTEYTLKKAKKPVRTDSVRVTSILSYENGTGANVYAAANPLRPGSHKRTKESIASVRHLYLDIDTDGDARLAALRASEMVPPPTSILSTSPGKYQVLWRVEGFDFARQEQTLKLLAIAFGGDPACTDCNRVLRIPGFLNRKYDPPYKATVEYPDDSIWTPDDFRLDAGAVDAMHFASASSPRRPPLKHSHSESDWAWVLHELAHGKDAVTLTHELASRRSDKPNPLYYAQRTIDVASARLWFIEGSSFDDVITMLESRRRCELPAALCSARAREIATTAQRMIAHGKTA